MGKATKPGRVEDPLIMGYLNGLEGGE